jgi:hypothetical protein
MAALFFGKKYKLPLGKYEYRKVLQETIGMTDSLLDV